MNNNVQKNSGEIASWVIILLGFIFFWPAGLLLLVRKLGSYSKRAGKSDANSAAGTKGNAAKTYSEPVNKTNIPGSQRKKPSTKMGFKGKLISVCLLMISICLFFFGLAGIISALPFAYYDSVRFTRDVIFGAFFCLGGFGAFLARGVWLRRVSRSNKYLAVIGDREIVAMSDISAATGYSPRKVRRDVQSLAEQGYFGPTAYVDSGLDSLVISPAAADEARRKEAGAYAESANQSAASDSNQYMGILRELRELNDQIIDGSISDKTDRITETTAKIFRCVEENPSKLPQIRKFMNYYLPTTLKLLRSYSTLEAQGIRGDNIAEAKKNIDRILGTLSEGFEQQLDQLFKTDAIDISSDIDVLENMLKQDGLDGDAPVFRTSGGH